MKTRLNLAHVGSWDTVTNADDNANADAVARAMILVNRTYLSRFAKNPDYLMFNYPS